MLWTWCGVSVPFIQSISCPPLAPFSSYRTLFYYLLAGNFVQKYCTPLLFYTLKVGPGTVVGFISYPISSAIGFDVFWLFCGMIKSDKNWDRTGGHYTAYLLHFFCFALILRVMEDPESTLNRIMKNVSFWPFNCAKQKSQKWREKVGEQKASKKRPFWQQYPRKDFAKDLLNRAANQNGVQKPPKSREELRESKNKPSKEIPVDLLKPSQELNVNFFHDKILLSAVLFE